MFKQSGKFDKEERTEFLRRGSVNLPSDTSPKELNPLESDRLKPYRGSRKESEVKTGSPKTLQNRGRQSDGFNQRVVGRKSGATKMRGSHYSDNSDSDPDGGEFVMGSEPLANMGDANSGGEGRSPKMAKAVAGKRKSRKSTPGDKGRGKFKGQRTLTKEGSSERKESSENPADIPKQSSLFGFMSMNPAKYGNDAVEDAGEYSASLNPNAMQASTNPDGSMNIMNS